jgi:hypothetical protein
VGPSPGEGYDQPRLRVARGCSHWPQGEEQIWWPERKDPPPLGGKDRSGLGWWMGDPAVEEAWQEALKHSVRAERGHLPSLLCCSFSLDLTVSLFHSSVSFKFLASESDYLRFSGILALVFSLDMSFSLFVSLSCSFRPFPHHLRSLFPHVPLVLALD